MGECTKLIKDNGLAIIKNSKNIKTCQSPLQQHQFPQIRMKVVDYMLHTSIHFHCSSSTFYLSVHIFDSFIFNQPHHSALEYKLIGVTALFIAAKFIKQHSLTLKRLTSSNKSIAAQDILSMELIIVKAIGFDLYFLSAADFISIFLYDFILSNRQVLELYNLNKDIIKMESICDFLAKLICLNNELSCVESSLKGMCCLLMAFDLVRSQGNWTIKAVDFVKEWLEMLINNYNVDIKMLEIVYSIIDGFYYDLLQRKSTI